MFEKLEKSISLSWEESEAPLYIMSCVASYLPLDEEKYVPNLIQLLVSTPTEIGIVHTAVKYTGVRLLAELNEWISKNDQKYLSNSNSTQKSSSRQLNSFRIRSRLFTFVTIGQRFTFSFSKCDSYDLPTM